MRVERFSSHQQWVIQPLIDAGLSLEHIQTLIFRLAFEAITDEGRPPGTDATFLVADQPLAVQTAWLTVIGRMILSTEDMRVPSSR